MVEAVVRDTMFEIGKDVLRERKEVASGLVVEKDNTVLERQDLLSVLVRSNLDEVQQRMTDEEVLARE